MHKLLQKSVLFFLIFIVSAFALLFMLDILEKNYPLRKDYSFNQYASVSQQSRQVLENIDKPIHIYSFVSNNNLDPYVETVLHNYSLLNKNIQHTNINLSKNPDFHTRFQSEKNANLSEDSLVIYAPHTQKYKVISPEDFVGIGFNIESGAYQFSNVAYEKSITEAIHYVNTSTQTTIYVSNGHGEPSASDMEVLLNFWKSKAYTIQFINFIDTNLKTNSLLFLPAIQKDLQETEVKNLQQFEKNGGKILSTLNYNTNYAAMPNYTTFLQSYGLQILDGIVQADEKDSASYYSNPLFILPYMQNLPYLEKLLNNNKNLLLLPHTRALELSASSQVSNAAIFKSGEKANLVNIEQTDMILQSGEFTLAAQAEKLNAGTNTSKLMVIGSHTALVDPYLYSIGFVNEFLDASLHYFFPNAAEGVNIAMQSAIRTNLKPYSKLPGFFLVLLCPIFILLISILILKKRKNR